MIEINQFKLNRIPLISKVDVSARSPTFPQKYSKKVRNYSGSDRNSQT